jgi:predicted alpha/beta-fold hydrolase
MIVTSPQKSTIVLKSLAFAAARAQFALGGWLAPAATAVRALRLFSTPLAASRARARATAHDGAQVSLIDVDGVSLAHYVWGDPCTQPYVLLAHGWSDYTLRFLPWVRALQRHGYAVVGFDQPGHGRSDKGRAYLVDFARNITAAIARFGTPAAVIGHSFGGAATALALSKGAHAERAVLIAAPADLIAATERFGRYIGLPSLASRRMRGLIESQLATPLDAFHIHRHVPALATPALVVHDIEDSEIPWAEGERYARFWPGAHLLSTSGLGHRRIVGDTGVIHAVLRFLNGGEVGERVISTTELPFGLA